MGKGDQSPKFVGKLRYLWIEDLPQEFLIETSFMNVEFLGNKTGKITAGAYLLSLAEIVYSVQQIKTGALLIVNNYSLVCGNDSSTYLFHSHSKDGNGNLSSYSREALLKFNTLYSLESYMQSVYYNAYPPTLNFQMQFIKVQCNANAKNAVKYALKRSEY